MVSETLRTSATRFLIWRTYKQLESDLGRIPFCSEIAAVAGISRRTVLDYLHTLDGCKVHGPGQTMYGDEDPDDITLDVVQFMERNGG